MSDKKKYGAKTKISYAGKTRNVPKKYVPKSLSKEDKKKQVKSIIEGKPRPKTSYKSKRSPHVAAFENKYGTKISDFKYIYKNIISKAGVDQIMNKGRAAYFTAGSRPNQTPESWALGRLAAVIMNTGGGRARKIDKAIWDKYKK